MDKNKTSMNDKITITVTRRQIDMLRDALAEFDNSIRRKKSWSPSEKAATLVDTREIWNIVNAADPVL